MLALKEKAEKELTQYNVELKELIRVIDHDRKLKEFMSCKDKERTEAHEQMEMMRRKKEAEKSSDRQNTVMVRDYMQAKLLYIRGINHVVFFCSRMSKLLSRLRKLLE